MMINVKLTIPGQPACPDLFEYTGNHENFIEGCKFFVNDTKIENADVWIVMDNLLKSESCQILSQGAVFVGAEVWRSPDIYLCNPGSDFLAQFSQVHTWFATNHSGLIRSLPFQPWMINCNHGSFFSDCSGRDVNWLRQVNSCDKPFEVSVICSNKANHPNYHVRLAFLRALKERLGDRLHWFGNGTNRIEQKWTGISPYKYHICMENQRCDNVITEKICDSFLGLAYPFYWGAPNADHHFPSAAFTHIDITNVNETVGLVQQFLEDDPYNHRLKDLKVAKERVLNEYNPFIRMARIAKTIFNGSSMSRTRIAVRLHPQSHFDSTTKGFLRRARNRFFG